MSDRYSRKSGDYAGVPCVPSPHVVRIRRYATESSNTTSFPNSKHTVGSVYPQKLDKTKAHPVIAPSAHSSCGTANSFGCFWPSVPFSSLFCRASPSRSVNQMTAGGPTLAPSDMNHLSTTVGAFVSLDRSGATMTPDCSLSTADQYPLSPQRWFLDSEMAATGGGERWDASPPGPCLSASCARVKWCQPELPTDATLSVDKDWEAVKYLKSSSDISEISPLLLQPLDLRISAQPKVLTSRDSENERLMNEELLVQDSPSPALPPPFSALCSPVNLKQLPADSADDGATECEAHSVILNEKIEYVFDNEFALTGGLEEIVARPTESCSETAYADELRQNSSVWPTEQALTGETGCSAAMPGMQPACSRNPNVIVQRLDERSTLSDGANLCFPLSQYDVLGNRELYTRSICPSSDNMCSVKVPKPSTSYVTHDCTLFSISGDLSSASTSTAEWAVPSFMNHHQHVINIPKVSNGRVLPSSSTVSSTDPVWQICDSSTDPTSSAFSRVFSTANHNISATSDVKQSSYSGMNSIRAYHEGPTGGVSVDSDSSGTRRVETHYPGGEISIDCKRSCSSTVATPGLYPGNTSSVVNRRTTVLTKSMDSGSSMTAAVAGSSGGRYDGDVGVCSMANACADQPRPIRVRLGVDDLGPALCSRTKKHTFWQRAGAPPPSSRCCRALHSCYRQTAEGGKYECILCGRQFVFKSGVLRHHRMVHHQERRYECSVCGALYFLLSDLKRHLLASHTNLQPFVCGQCGEQFNRAADLRKHSCHDQRRRLGRRKHYSTCFSP